MTNETTSFRRCEGAGEQSRGMSATCSGAIAGREDCGLRIDEAVQPRPPGSLGLSVSLRSAADCGLEQSGLHADGVRYGPMGLVALEVVGVPVRRGLVIDDELSLLWRREARLMEVKAELAAAREWGLVQLLRRRLAKVDVRQEELWRRWKEMRGAESICKSLVVVGEGRGA
jgi:hypothetical protein